MGKVTNRGGIWNSMSKKGKLVIGHLLFAFLLAFLITDSVDAATISDIPHDYASEINYLIEQGVIQGYPDGTFKPDELVKRQEAATMIGRALKLNGTQRDTIFPDVDASSYASGYIQSATDRFIINGQSDGLFHPDDLIRRGHMAFLLERAFKLTEVSNVSFLDVTRQDTQTTAINRIATAGLTNGYPDGTYKPDNPISRVEYALLVARGLNPEFRISKVKDPIKEDPIKEEPIKEEPIKQAYVNVSSWDVLNVRSGPGTNHSVVGELKMNAEVSVYRYEGHWASIKSGNVTGYVNSNYLSSSLSSKRVIVIDAGHGGSDPGAIGNGIREKDLNLDVALRVERLLKEKGIEVIMTRRNDTALSLKERVNIADKSDANAFVSIHGNSFSASSNGTETFYYSAASTRVQDSEQLATFIQNRLYPALGTKNRGVRKGNLHVLRENRLPAALVELGFISNKEDASKLSSNYYRDKAAEAITQGIVDYFNWKK